MAYDDILANLAEVDDEQLDTAHGEVLGRLNELRPRIESRELSPEELAELQGTGDQPGLRQVYDDLSAQVGERRQRRDEAYAALDQTLANVPTGDEPEGGSETGGNAETEQPAEQETPAEGENTGQEAAPPQTQATQAAESTQGQPVAAAASNPPIGTIGRQNGNGDGHNGNTRPAGTRASIAITAAGKQIEFGQIGEQLASRLSALQRDYRSDGEQIGVVSLVASGVPEERKLRRNAPGENTNKLDGVTSQAAITAAGGLCAPLAIDYSYDVIGVQGRPVRDSLPGFQAERGGIQFRPHLSPVTNTDADGPHSATGHWTMADDVAAEDPADYSPMPAPGNVSPPTKALWVVDCPDTVTAEVEAITLQLEFSNVTSRFDPETVQANQSAALIWHDRHCENWLLEKLRSLSKVMTSGQVLGATRDMLVTLDRVQAYYRSVHRLSANVQLRAIMPSWVRHLIRADLARGMSLDPMASLAISDEQIDSLLRTRNLTPVWHLDGQDADQAEVAYSAGPPVVSAVPGIEQQQYVLAQPSAEGLTVPNFPAQVDMLLHTEGHFQHLDGGTLDLGIVRDSDLIERNRYREFTETWEGVAARGVEALRLIADVWPTGETAGAVEVASEIPDGTFS